MHHRQWPDQERWQSPRLSLVRRSPGVPVGGTVTVSLTHNGGPTGKARPMIPQRSPQRTGPHGVAIAPRRRPPRRPRQRFVAAHLDGQPGQRPRRPPELGLSPPARIDHDHPATTRPRNDRSLPNPVTVELVPNVVDGRIESNVANRSSPAGSAQKSSTACCRHMSPSQAAAKRRVAMSPLAGIWTRTAFSTLPAQSPMASWTRAEGSPRSSINRGTIRLPWSCWTSPGGAAIARSSTRSAYWC